MADEVRKYQNAVDIIKTAILQSQARAAKAVNQEQLALYYGIGRYVSANLSVATDEFTQIDTSGNSAVATADFTDDDEIRQSRLANLSNFPLAEFFYAGYIMQDVS